MPGAESKHLGYNTHVSPVQLYEVLISTFYSQGNEARRG